MKAVMAGLMAWSIEVTIMLIMLLVLRHEEKKVFKGREK